MAGNEEALDIVPSRSPKPKEWNLEMPSTDTVAALKSEVSRRREDMNAVLDDISARQSRRPAVEESRHAPETAPEPAGLRQSLISDQTGKQVAAAFGELSEAFAARSKKSLDEMAEDMLRPMLQDWLDNNLPLLVERLVREEIERVARGS
jgi:cell pole-organizing protein PopZ